ncbi:MAG: hypothetical protein KGI71_05170 [Patescibacteria group bacterium]|nr:hypothetical protein [Patescibacteria group bacterium]
MAGVGAPFGNNYAVKRRPWADAINRALARREQTKSGADLNKLADKLIDAAAEGDMAALKELGDRLDGKPHQTGEIELRGSLTEAIESLPVARRPSETGPG